VGAGKAGSGFGAGVATVATAAGVATELATGAEMGAVGLVVITSLAAFGGARLRVRTTVVTLTTRAATMTAIGKKSIKCLAWACGMDWLALAWAFLGRGT